MNFITCLAFLAGIANTYATFIPAPARDTRYPNGIVVTTYPNGLPAGLYPRTEPISRAIGLEKRDPQLVIDGPVVDVQAPQPVVVYACSEINFTGACVRITSAPGQCVQAVSGQSPSNDNTSSIGTDRGNTCRAFVQFRCEESEGAFDFQYPGISDLSLTLFDNKISSYRCN